VVIPTRTEPAATYDLDELNLKVDGLAKSPKYVSSVIPAEAGIQCPHTLENSWTPFFNGVTDLHEIIKVPFS
jgi:hypothetical protein